MDQRRHFSRVPFDIDSTLVDDEVKLDISVIDLSLKGALITKPPEWSQSNCQGLLLKMRLVDSDVIMQMKCDVAHEHGNSIGLKFVEIDVDSISHLRRLMELNVGDSDLINREVNEL